MPNALSMVRASSLCLALLGLMACSSRLPDNYSIPENVKVGLIGGSFKVKLPYVRPTPEVLPNDAPPKIMFAHFDTLDIYRSGSSAPNAGVRGGWSGQFMTSTNVASLEVRTSLFSINVPRSDFGRFAFSVDVLDLPPIFIRGYRLRVIARNSAGVEAEEDLPLRIH